MERYQGKKVVIIGGTSGMGLATAKMLIDGGARVLVTGLSKAGLESAQKELGKGAIVVSSDARSLTDIDALASRVTAEFGTFDLLSVRAGFSTRAPLGSITEAVYDEMFNLNAKGPLFASSDGQSGLNRAPSDESGLSTAGRFPVRRKRPNRPAVDNPTASQPQRIHLSSTLELFKRSGPALSASSTATNSTKRLRNVATSAIALT